MQRTRLLAVAWFVLAITTLIVKVVVSALVFRRVEYTLEAVAMLSLLPPFQAMILSLLARDDSPSSRLTAAASLASRRSLRLAWALVALVLTAWLVVSGQRLAPGLEPRALLAVISGAILSSGGLVLALASHRRRQTRGAGRLLPCAVVCSALGLLLIAPELGWRLSGWPTLAVVTAAAWAVAAALLLPCLVQAATALRPGPALLLDSAAVLAAFTLSALPLVLYLRPYLGVAWLDPCRASLLAGTILILGAATCAEAPRTSGEAPSPAAPPGTLRPLAALWLTLQSTYLVGWLAIGLLLVGSPDLSPAACTLLVVIPAAQTVALRVAQALRARRRELA